MIPATATQTIGFSGWAWKTHLRQYVDDRRRLVDRLRELSASDWNRTAEHGEYSHYSVFIMFRHLALHDFFHAYRIEELLLKKEWTSEWQAFAKGYTSGQTSA